MSDRRQALEDLVSHPGWALFRDHVADEWAPAGCWRKVKDLSATADLTVAMQKVDYTNEQVGTLMRWPQEEVERLLRQEAAKDHVQARGGYHR